MAAFVGPSGASGVNGTDGATGATGMYTKLCIRATCTLPAASIPPVLLPDIDNFLHVFALQGPPAPVV
jgi:hypothetical protein